MDTQSTLTTVAEVGIAIVGFSTIAAAFVSRGVGVDKLALWITLRSLLQTSAAVTLFAFLPMVLWDSSLHETTVWVISSFVYMVWLATVRVSLFFDREARSVSGFSAFVYSWFGVFSFAFHLYNVVFERTGWPYLAALVTGLFIAFTQFYSLVRDLVTFTGEQRRDNQNDA